MNIQRLGSVMQGDTDGLAMAEEFRIPINSQTTVLGWMISQSQTVGCTLCLVIHLVIATLLSAHSQACPSVEMDVVLGPWICA